MENFQIIQPSLCLAPYVKQYWFLRTPDNPLSPQRIIATGFINLIFHRADNMFSLTRNENQPEAFISGQSTGYSDLMQMGKVDMISVVFTPHGARSFFKMPISELYKKEISIADLNDKELLDLQDRLFEASDNFQAVRLIESFLLSRLYISKEHNQARISAVIKAINAGQMNINNLADISCLSYKQFKRIFFEYVGTNPKDFLRIIRFQKALHILQTHPDTSLSQLAFESGYYDQPHLIKEFKLLSGYTPREYINTCAPYSDYFS